ncbi:hotdog fold thioesterase [Bacillus glycinifermentans]|nr:hotdog fold thioesterase [Bacillus glycinifermentans]
MRRLLVIDDHPAVMEGTKAILETNQDFLVDCLSPEASEQFLTKHDFSAYDLILMDLNLGEINGMDLSKKILETCSSCKIIVYTGYEVEDYFEEAIRSGMPVDERTRQPFGFLHGGASVALAETVASIGAYQHIDPKRQACFGLEINANHIKSIKEGTVKAVATPLHVGRSTMVFHIDIRDEEDRLISVSRCTMAVVQHSSSS